MLEEKPNLQAGSPGTLEETTAGALPAPVSPVLATPATVTLTALETGQG